jgi:hypothetical protein
MTYDIGELCFSDQALGLCPNKLLLELNNLGVLGLFVLELRNLIRNLTHCQY